jgi:glutamate-1-semialdehyde 2,1-aminomutase
MPRLWHALRMLPVFSESQAFWGKACKVMPAGVSSQFRRMQRPVPLFFSQGQGSQVVDADGNRLCDYTLGWGPLILGHSHPSVVEAVCRQVRQGITFGAQHPLEAQVAERICQLNRGHEQVVFQTTGTEAVALALRLARAHTGRRLVIRFANHYHGWLDNVLAKVGPDTLATPLPTTEGQAPGSLVDTLCLPWNNLDAVRAAFERYPAQIAAVLTEPIAINGGGIWPATGFLQSLRALCSDRGALLVFDEVITGFRVSTGGAAAVLGVQPDLAVYGKALSSGFALSAVAGRSELLAPVGDGRVFQAGTLNGQPVAMAAALATLDELDRDDGAALTQLRSLGERLQTGLRLAFAERDLPLHITGHGSVFWTHLSVTAPVDLAAVAAIDKTPYATFAERLLNHHVLVMQTGRWYVSAAHRSVDIEQTLAAVRETFCDPMLVQSLRQGLR